MFLNCWVQAFMECSCPGINFLFPTRRLWQPQLEHVGVDVVEGVRAVLEVFFNLVTLSRSADIRRHGRSSRFRSGWWRLLRFVRNVLRRALSRRCQETLPDGSYIDMPRLGPQRAESFPTPCHLARSHGLPDQRLF